jgi:tetratricopeptide (TPR) repeat protein
MPQLEGLDRLDSTAWDRLADLAGRFEEAWERGPAPADIAAFLPPPEDALRACVLEELIKTDLEIRWRRGLPADLTGYLQRFPELGDARDLPAALVYEEYRVRQLYGDRPALDLYARRFPAQLPELEQLLRDQPLPQPAPAVMRPSPATPHIRLSDPNVVLPGSPYLLQERIGSGSFGEVWRAVAPGGVEVAIKILTGSADAAEAQREHDALELMKRLRHPFLIQVQAFWPLEDRLLMVMELANGSLAGRLEDQRRSGRHGVPTEDLLGYMREAAAALDYLHEQGVLHRDVKPANLLLVGDHAKLADFGLARLMQSRRLINASGCGTPLYMAPEMWRHEVTPQSDQYSLAASYVELRLDRPLFPSRRLPDLMADHLERTPNLAGLLPAEQQVLHKALAKQPGDRYPSCAAFVQALQQALLQEQVRGPATVELVMSDTSAALAPAEHTVLATASAAAAGGAQADALEEVHDCVLSSTGQVPRPAVDWRRPSGRMQGRGPGRPSPAWRRGLAVAGVALALGAGLAAGWLGRGFSPSPQTGEEAQSLHPNATPRGQRENTAAPEVDPATLACRRGVDLLRARHEQAALAAFDEAIRLRADFALAYNWRGDALFRLGRLDAALREYNTAIRLNPMLAVPYNNRGAYYLQTHQPNRLDKAIVEFTRAIRYDPSLIQAYQNRGDAYVEQHAWDRAIADFKRVIALDGREARAHGSLAAAYWQRRRPGDLDRALEECAAALKLEPNDTWAYSVRVAVREARGDKRGADADRAKLQEIRLRLEGE